MFFCLEALEDISEVVTSTEIYFDKRRGDEDESTDYSAGGKPLFTKLVFSNRFVTTSGLYIDLTTLRRGVEGEATFVKKLDEKVKECYQAHTFCSYKKWVSMKVPLLAAAAVSVVAAERRDDDDDDDDDNEGGVRDAGPVGAIGVLSRVLKIIGVWETDVDVGIAYKLYMCTKIS